MFLETLEIFKAIEINGRKCISWVKVSKRYYSSPVIHEESLSSRCVKVQKNVDPFPRKAYICFHVMKNLDNCISSEYVGFIALWTFISEDDCTTLLDKQNKVLFWGISIVIKA